VEFRTKRQKCGGKNRGARGEWRGEMGQLGPRRRHDSSRGSNEVRRAFAPQEKQKPDHYFFLADFFAAGLDFFAGFDFDLAAIILFLIRIDSPVA